MVQELVKTEELASKYNRDKGALIQILLEIQRENNWLPKDALTQVSQQLNVPLSRVYHVATFYKAFSLVPRGKHLVRVCLGTACHTREAPRLLENIVEVLKVKPGSTSEDNRFSLTTVNCMGCCALGPVIEVDGIYHSKPSREELEKIFTAFQ